MNSKTLGRWTEVRNQAQGGVVMGGWMHAGGGPQRSLGNSRGLVGAPEEVEAPSWSAKQK